MLQKQLRELKSESELEVDEDHTRLKKEAELL